MSKLTNVKRSNVWIFGTMLFFGLAALTAALTLSIDHVLQLKNAHAQLSCDFNLVFNCGHVMETWQASLFGFPNPFIGLIGFAVVVTVAMSGLAGVKFPRWYLITAQIFYGLGLIFAYWLFFQSVYAIQVLCPWCLVVTTSTTIIFETLLRYNLRENTFGFSKGVFQKLQWFLERDYDKFIVACWIVIMAALVVVKFGSGLFA